MTRSLKLTFITFGIIIIGLLILTLPLPAAADSLTLAWDPNSETDLIGYRLYYKSQGTGAPYNGKNADQGPSPVEVDLSDSPQLTLTGLNPAFDYEFAVTAYNSTGESDFSTPVRVFSISSQAGANGQVDPDEFVWVKSGDNHSVTITPSGGYRIVDVVVDGNSVGAVFAYIFTNVSGNHSLSATFEVDTTDSDGDGLTDYKETTIYETDPQLADTDADGIDDGDELAHWGTNWNQDIDGDTIANLVDADADGDGYLDGEELNAGSDPGDPDIIPDTTQLAMEFGEVENNHIWQKVNFTGSYRNPIVVANVASFNEGDPSTVRIRNVSSTGFEIRIQEWDYLDEWHITEKVGYLVMESGTHFLDNGAMVVAGHIDTDRTRWTTHHFPDTFSDTPVVMLSVNSYNEDDTLTVRLCNIDISGFQYRLQEQEANKKFHADEQIAYIAWEPSQGKLDRIYTYEVGRKVDAIKHIFTYIGFRQTFTKAPVLLANMQSADDRNTATLRWQNKDLNGMEIKIEEEKSKDTETEHVTEVFGYMVFDTNY